MSPDGLIYYSFLMKKNVGIERYIQTVGTHDGLECDASWNLELSTWWVFHSFTERLEIIIKIEEVIN